jgi:hypothetical protein
MRPFFQAWNTQCLQNHAAAPSIASVSKGGIVTFSEYLRKRARLCRPTATLVQKNRIHTAAFIELT